MSTMQWGTPARFPAVYEELLVPGFFTAFADEMLDRGQPRDRESMLDVATGTGIVLRRARVRCPSLARAVGLDLTAGMLAVAREKSEGLDIEYVEGDAASLPFEDAAFDLVTCQQGLQFFPAREQALREFRRVLAPGGRAVVACWCDVETAPAHQALTDALRQHFPDREPVARVPFSLSSADELRSLLHEAGFGDVDVERVAGTARFSSPEDFSRSFMEGSPMAIAMADVPQEQRDALARDIAMNVRERFGEPVVAPMVTHIATARA
ncbi:MAG: methyltransferase protein [Solirubrobacterales bacterium]|nr:methyltransferase protein [Solirubrobacterales bacterium]